MAADVRETNHQTNMMFIQQEHANTLKALHEEIARLQKRCAELTFQIAMDATSLPEEQEDYKEKCEELTKRLQQSTSEKKTAAEEVDKKNRRISMLEQQLKAQETKFKDEIKTKDRTILRLEGELRDRCDELATAKMAQISARSPQSSPASSLSDSQEYFKSPSEMVPHPPKISPIKHSRAGVSESYPLKALASVKNRPASGRKMSNEVFAPDPDILKIAHEQKQHFLRSGEVKKMAPLPKFNTNLVPRNTNSGNFAKRVRPKPLDASSRGDTHTEINVETLAVDQVRSTDSALRRAREFNSSET